MSLLSKQITADDSLVIDVQHTERGAEVAVITEDGIEPDEVLAEGEAFTCVVTASGPLSVKLKSLLRSLAYP